MTARRTAPPVAADSTAPVGDAARGRRSAAVSSAPAAVSDEELTAIALRIPALFHAAKSNGGPSPDEIKRLIGGAALGPRHFNALSHVMAGGPMTVTALGARLGVALSTASLMVAELSRAGLLERVEDDDDRRRTIVRVAPQRLAACDSFLNRRLGPLRRTLARLTPAERAAFARGLDVLTEELSAAGPAGADSAAPGAAPAEARLESAAG
ncbi:MAG TPA: MarR family winged helix-turn-helix transcriptional regulator [Candidatus Dormibacteraeota bacterium]